MEAMEPNAAHLWEALVARADGPMVFRVSMLALTAGWLAVSAGLRESRDDPARRRGAASDVAGRRNVDVNEFGRDVASVATGAFLADLFFQVTVLDTHHLGESLLVSGLFSVVPYALLRRFTRRVARAPAHPPAGERPLDAATKLAYRRTFVAYERTLLAWTRTSFALITFGFSVAKLLEAEGRSVGIGLRAWDVALTLVSLGVFSLMGASLTLGAAIHALRALDAELPRSMALVLAGLVAALGAGTLVTTLLGG